MPKLYTVAEANALLLELTTLLEDLQSQAEILAGIQNEFREVRKQVQTNGHGGRTAALTGQATAAEQQVRVHLARLQDLDIELKDVQTGLIDFYHEREGRIVYLCWKLGEPSVGYWHDLDAGFAGRRPL